MKSIVDTTADINTFLTELSHVRNNMDTNNEIAISLMDQAEKFITE